MSRRVLVPAHPRVGAIRRPTGPSVSDRLAPLSRRSLLRGLFRGSAVALSLPFLEVFLDRRALACGGAIPKRFGLYCWGNDGSVLYLTSDMYLCRIQTKTIGVGF